MSIFKKIISSETLEKGLTYLSILILFYGSLCIIIYFNQINDLISNLAK